MPHRSQPFVTLAIALLAAGCFSQAQGPTETIAERSKALLWQAPYPDILVEVDYARDPPAELALESLVATIRNVTLKNRVTIAGPEQLPAEYRQSREWTIDELGVIGESTRESAPPMAHGAGTYAVIHVVYLMGTVKELPDALGVQIGGTAFLFGSEPAAPRIPESLIPTPGPIFERALLIHEVGHVLGLVDNGISMVTPHSDDASPAHSANRESVMYRAIDGFRAQEGVIFPNEGPPYQFDENDLADIRYAQSLEPKAR